MHNVVVILNDTARYAHTQTRGTRTTPGQTHGGAAGPRHRCHRCHTLWPSSAFSPSTNLLRRFKGAGGSFAAAAVPRSCGLACVVLRANSSRRALSSASINMRPRSTAGGRACSTQSAKLLKRAARCGIWERDDAPAAPPAAAPMMVQATAGAPCHCAAARPPLKPAETRPHRCPVLRPAVSAEATLDPEASDRCAAIVEAVENTKAKLMQVFVSTSRADVDLILFCLAIKVSACVCFTAKFWTNGPRKIFAGHKNTQRRFSLDENFYTVHSQCARSRVWATSQWITLVRAPAASAPSLGAASPSCSWRRRPPFPAGAAW